MLVIITIISINVSFQKQVRKNYFDVKRKFHTYVHVCVHYVYLPMKGYLDDTGNSPQIHVNSKG